MYVLNRGGNLRAVNIWPGFVDGLATLLLVVIFVLMVFMVAQFFLSTALTGRDEALHRLQREIVDLAELLSLERSANADLRIDVSQLSSELQTSLTAQESLTGRLAALIDARDTLQTRLSVSEAARESTARMIEDARGSVAAAKATIAEQLARLATLEQLGEETSQLLRAQEAAAAKVSQELVNAYQVIEADKEKIEVQLAQLATLERLRAELAERLRGQEAAAAKVSQELVDAYQVIEADKEKIDAQLQDLAILQSLRDDLMAKLGQAEVAGETQKKLTDEAQAQILLLNRQIAALRQQLSRLAVSLEVAEADVEEKNVQIANLGRRLNVALASKVQELARYRSEFFGRLREVLGQRQDIRIVGDRFVFQSEVLFASGSAELGEPGQRQLEKLGRTLKEIAARIPKDLTWILRVDGHTDRAPIATPEFPSNWELSTGRAISVVKFLVSLGISADHLAATGFGEFQPLDPGQSLAAFRRNRRIELKLTQR